MLHKQPIRTYTRKKLAMPEVESYRPQISFTPKEVAVHRKRTKQSKLIDAGQHPHADNSLGDPFETTFDRLLKETVMPPPLPVESDPSWLSSSSENSNDETKPSISTHVSNSFCSINSTNTEARKKPRKHKKVTIKKKILMKTPKSGKKRRARRKKVQPQTSININKSSNDEIYTTYSSGKEILYFHREHVTDLTSKTSDNKSQNINIKNSDSFHEMEDINNYQNGERNDFKEKKITRNRKKKKYGLKKQNSTNLLNLPDHLNTVDISKPPRKTVQRKKQKSKKPANNSIKDLSIVINAWTGLDKGTNENISSSSLCVNTNEEASKMQSAKLHMDKVSSRFINYNLSESLESVRIKPCSVMLVNNSIEKCKTDHSSTFNMHNDLCGFHTNGEAIFKSPNGLCLPTQLFSDPSIKIKNCSVYLNRVKPSSGANVPKKFATQNQTLICSTPMEKRKNPSNHLITVSPIICLQRLEHHLLSYKEDTILTYRDDRPTDDTCQFSTNVPLLNNKNQCIEEKSVKKYVSNCNSESKNKISDLSNDSTNVQLEQTQVAILSQSYKKLLGDKELEENDSKDELDISTTRKCQSQCLLNVSEASDRTRSLFDDTNNNSNYLREGNLTNNFHNTHGLNSKPSCAILEEMNSTRQSQLANVSKASFLDKICVPKVESLNSNLKECVVNLSLRYTEDMQENKNDCAIEKSKEQAQNKELSVDVKEVINVTQSTWEVPTVNIERMSNTQTSNGNNVSNRLSARLQDPFRITDRRKRNRKWNLHLADICESQDDAMKISENKELHPKKFKNANDISVNNSSFTHRTNNLFSLERYSSIQPLQTSVYLKPGKSWARSLSILSNIHNGLNLDDLSIGKGKKWMHSVKDILSMQEQGIIQSCVKNVGDVRDSTTCSQTVHRNSQHALTDNRLSTFGSASTNRFSRRVSVRVVPDSKRSTCIEDTPFREAYGITGTHSRSSVSLKLRESNQHDIHCSNENIEHNETHSGITAKEVILQRCGQDDYLDFDKCFPDSYLKYCKKIGEGVYGEVFLYENEGQRSVIKIIPIEGDELVNGEPQKKFDEILSEIVISKELHNLRFTETYNTSGFVEVVNVKCIIGKYPEKLVNLWTTYDEEKTSDNDCPSMFNENQLYITLELGHGGQDLEAFVFQTAVESHAVFVQSALALAVAEKCLEFEHRDLHWGNVLISRTNETHVHYKLDNKDIFLPSKGVKVSIIDFTLSRMSYEGCCIFNDLALDPALFTAKGEYQFEIYRLMRDKTGNNWQNFEPYTNILWLHYTLDKMITAARYKKKSLKMHKKAIVDLMELKDVVLDYDSAFDFVMNCDKFANLCNNSSPLYTSARSESIKTRRILTNPVAVL